jgi:hypothetical protein
MITLDYFWVTLNSQLQQIFAFLLCQRLRRCSLLSAIARISIIAAVGYALWITVDVLRPPQSMDVMNAVWTISALYFGLIAL